MNTSLTRRLRWLAPAVAVGVVAGGVVLPQLAGASDDLESLPVRTAAELLVAVSEAEVDGLSGTVVSTSRLGLPELPSTGGGSAVSLAGVLSGSTTARVWSAGDDRSRIAVDGAFSEFDVVRDGRDVWTFDSASSDVTHLVLPEKTAAEQPAPASRAPGAATPRDAAEAVLSLVDPSTAVTVGSSEVVAGRAAYELVLTPRDAGTLVESVRIAVDGETSIPLRVRVFGKGQVEPALEVGFTSVDLSQPDDAVFDFVVPPGSEVTEKALPGRPDVGAPQATDPPRSGSAPTVLGEGWTTVVQLDGVEVPDGAEATLAQLSTPVDGGRVLTSALLSVLLLDDGRVLVGAVPVDRLVELAGR